MQALGSSGSVPSAACSQAMAAFSASRHDPAPATAFAHQAMQPDPTQSRLESVAQSWSQAAVSPPPPEEDDPPAPPLVVGPSTKTLPPQDAVRRASERKA